VTDTTELKGDYWLKYDVKIMLNIVDAFSRFAWSYFIASKKAVDVAAAFEHLFSVENEIPDTLKSDNGTEFKNDLMK
jgi:transposase InsO family protein